MSSDDRSDRFKVGDIVRKVRIDTNGTPPIGTEVEISKCDGDGLPWYWVTIADEDVLDDIEWELSAVCLSPLWDEIS